LNTQLTSIPFFTWLEFVRCNLIRGPEFESNPGAGNASRIRSYTKSLK